MVRRYFSVFAIIAIILGWGGFVLLKRQEEEAKLRLAEKRASLRSEFGARVEASVGAPEETAYLRTIRGALKAYEDGLNKEVYGAHPDGRDADAYRKQSQRLLDDGEINAAQLAARLEGFGFVKDAYEVVRLGQWRPVLTSAGKGGTRLDIYSVSRTEAQPPVLEAKFLFWGVDAKSSMGWGDMRLLYWGGETGNKVLGRADGESQPRIMIQDPGKYIADFPANVSVGILWLPLMPRQATSVDIEYTYTVTQHGVAETSSLKWTKFKIPDAWKLREGEVWEADEIEATEDEMAGRDK